MPSYIEKRRRVWYAVLDVPADVEKRVGKRRLVQSLKTESKTEAERLVLPVIGRWKNEFDALRSGVAKNIEALAMVHAQTIKDAEADYVEDADYHQLADIYEELAQDEAQRIAEKDPVQAELYYELAKGRTFPFGQEIDGWLATRELEPKTVDMYRSALRKVKEAFPYTHQIDQRMVRKWVEQMQVHDGLSRSTVSRYVSCAKGYWEYLYNQGFVDTDINPFADVLPNVKQKMKGNRAEKRKPFRPTQIVELLAAARKKNDLQLSNVIELAMWTGCRIEELCSMRVADVETDRLCIRDAKSEAGIRDVPIHPKLANSIRNMIKSSDDGYVISGLTFNTYGHRSNAVGKRFGTMKTGLGYGEDYVFHSIRKTVATQLENAGVPEGVSADILGHKKGTITYGLYSGGSGFERMQEAIGKLEYPALP